MKKPDDKKSLDEWKEISNFDKAETDGARAQQLNITIEELRESDEAEEARGWFVNNDKGLDKDQGGFER